MTRRLLSSFLSGAVGPSCACLLPALLIWIDIAVLNLGCDEVGVVELTQSVCLLTIVVLLAIATFRRGDLRGGLVLVTALFLDMLIRENDGFLDELSHGCWVYPVTAVTVVAVGCAWRWRQTFFAGLMRLRTARSFPVLAIGFFTLTVYSRIFGMKAIWRTVVGCDDYRPAKHVAEEGVELLAYFLLLYWVIGFFREVMCEKRT